MATTQALVACLNTLDTNPTQNLDLLFELSRDLAVRQEAARHNAISKLSTLFNHYYSLRHESNDNTVMLFKILRVMRNLCGNVPETPIAIRDAQILEATYQLLDEYTHKSALNEHDYLLLRTIVTLHSNMVVSSAEIKREIWLRVVHSALYWRITDLAHTPLNAHIAMCLLNCIANDSELRAQLLQEDQPAMRLYMKLLDLAALETDEHENVNTSVFYWVFLLFQKLLDRFDELMMLARDIEWQKTDQSDGSEPTSTRQVLLLKFLEARVEELNAQPTLLDAAHKARMLKYLEQRFEELEAKEMVFTARIKFSDEAQFKRDLEALYLIVRILSHILECASSEEKEVLRTAGLLITVIRMFKNSLDHEAELERARKETGVELRREKMAKTRIVEEEFNFKVELMKLVCNMCYRHRASQDEVRELKGLPAILNHCNIDDNNPYIKEWAIVTLRNLCENNAENQEAIASLKTQGVLATEELERLGLQAKLEDNGKVTISKK